MEFKKIEVLKLPPPIKQEEEEIVNTSELSFDEIKEQALKEKERILASAYLEAKSIKDIAQKEGYDAGYQQGLSSAKLQLKDFQHKISNEYQNFLENFHKGQELLIKNASKEVLEIALFISKKLVGDIINQKEDLVIELYKLLTPTITDKNITEIMVNPNDFQMLKEYIIHINKVHQISVSENEEISKGSIKVITEQGSILYDLNQQMEEIIMELRKVYA